MTQQEIKAGIYNTPWERDGWNEVGNVDFMILRMADNTDHIAHGDVSLNAAAIVSAVNNTYGIGVNPEKVPDMIKKLRGAAALLYELDCADQAKDIETLLTSAKL